MKINPYIFRGNDIRGVVGKDLNPKIVEHLGRAYGSFLSKRGIKKAVVGYDCRLTSKDYSQALIKGLVSTGINVIDIGLTLVGIFYWAQYYFNVKGGAMVTASHNPAEYNGFKLATGFSQAMVAEETQEIREIALKENFARPKNKGKNEKRAGFCFYWHPTEYRANSAFNRRISRQLIKRKHCSQ